MKKLFLSIGILLLCAGLSAQIFDKDVKIIKSNPKLYLNNNYLSVSGGALKLNGSSISAGSVDLSDYAKKNNAVFTGTHTIPSPFTLSGTSVTATGANLNLTTGGTSNFQTQLNNTVAGSTLYVAKGDSTVVAGGYTSKYDFNTGQALKVSYTDATADLALGAHNFTSTGLIDVSASNAGIASITGLNTSNTDGSSGVYGHGYGSSTGTYYGLKGISNGAANGGVNIGVYGESANGTANWGGCFIGNIQITGGIVQTQLVGALTDGAPTDTEIDTVTGKTPSTAGTGYQVTIRDNSGTALLYRIESDGVNWFYIVMVKAI